MDAIDACLEVLKKEVADLEACREHLLSSITSPSCFEDQTLISSLWLNCYIIFIFIFIFFCVSFLYVYFLSTFSLPSTLLYFSSTYLISLTWLIYFGFVIYYATFAIAITIIMIQYVLLILHSLHYFLQIKAHYNTFLWHYPLQRWSLGGKKERKQNTRKEQLHNVS